MLYRMAGALSHFVDKSYRGATILTHPGVGLVLRGQTLFSRRGVIAFGISFSRGAYTESDNAPARKIGPGHARLG